MTEDWRPTHHPHYEVSSDGRVRSRAKRKLRVLKPQVARGGYLFVHLGRPSSQYVHRLVAAAFIGPCPEGQIVRYKDDNPGNPEVSNLEYGTQSQNNLDSVQRGRWGDRSRKGEKNFGARLTSAQVLEIRELGSALSQGELARNYGVSVSAISAILTRRSWAHV